MIGKVRYTIQLLLRMHAAYRRGEVSELAEGARLEIVYASKGYPGFESPPLRQIFALGGVAEWSKAAVSKTVIPAFPVSRVRIPTPPPDLVFQNRCAFKLIRLSCG